MADIKFKELNLDNVFDFCEVIKAIGAEEIISSVNPKEITEMQKQGKDSAAIGVVMAMKFSGILIKNLSKARKEIYAFFAGCTRWDNGKDATVEEISHLKPSAAVKLIKDFTKLEDLSDFFKEVSSLFDMMDQTEQEEQEGTQTVLKSL